MTKIPIFSPIGIQIAYRWRREERIAAEMKAD